MTNETNNVIGDFAFATLANSVGRGHVLEYGYSRSQSIATLKSCTGISQCMLIFIPFTVLNRKI